MNNLDQAKKEIVDLIKYRAMGLFKSTIQRELTNKGLKKTNISKGLRDLRKENIVGLYRRRWCLR